MLRQIMEIYEILDDFEASGDSILRIFNNFKYCTCENILVNGKHGSTDFVRLTIKGVLGKCNGGTAPTLGITGRLGGVGARPERIGFVSDGDGSLAALAAALKLCQMSEKGDRLKGDVIVSTHISTSAPIILHEPVSFMDSPVETERINQLEANDQIDAILSIDTTKGNIICNHRGIAITSTVKSGYVLKVSDDLLAVYQRVSGILPVVLPISTQDITPYGNGIYHINSIMQPATATDAPVVGVAITAQSAVAGCATGATQFSDCELAMRFSVEVAKDFTGGHIKFYDEDEFAKLVEMYGDLERFQQKVD